MPKAYPLQTSLSMYADWIPGVLFEHSCEFDKLSDATAIGCFCENGDMCHTNILLQVMKTQYPQRIHFPRFQCLKVKYLRKAGYTDLRQWLATDGNVACVRSGRIFIKSEGDTRPMIFITRLLSGTTHIILRKSLVSDPPVLFRSTRVFL